MWYSKKILNSKDGQTGTDSWNVSALERYNLLAATLASCNVETFHKALPLCVFLIFNTILERCFKACFSVISQFHQFYDFDRVEAANFYMHAHNQHHIKTEQSLLSSWGVFGSMMGNKSFGFREADFVSVSFVYSRLKRQLSSEFPPFTTVNPSTVRLRSKNIKQIHQSQKIAERNVSIQ